MFISRILKDVIAIRQKIRIKNTFADFACSIFLMKES